MSDNKENIDNDLAQWLSGSLSSEKARELEASGKLDDLKHVMNDLNLWSVLPFETEGKLSDLKTQLHSKSSKGKLISLPMLLRYAAILILPLALYFVIDFYNLNSKTIQLQAAVGEQLQHYLPDSSMVIISPQSSISYNSKAYTDLRDIELKGQAYFEVKEGSPFNVKSSTGIVAVLGTRFDIRDLDETYKVNCFDGKVKVSIEDKQQFLTATKGLFYKKGNLKLIDIEQNKPVWTTGISYYKAVELQEVITDINRYSNVQIELPKKHRSLQFTGVIIQGDRLNQSLQSLFNTMGISYILNKDNTVTFN